jgi:hypothetical protein
MSRYKEEQMTVIAPNSAAMQQAEQIIAAGFSPAAPSAPVSVIKTTFAAANAAVIQTPNQQFA